MKRMKRSNSMESTESVTPKVVLFWQKKNEETGITKRNLEIYEKYLTGSSQASLGREYGMTRARIHQIIQRIGLGK